MLTWQWLDRLGAWATLYLVPAAACVLLLVDFLVGMNWTLSPEHNLTSPAYDTGEQVMALRHWGVLFLVLTGVSAAMFLTRGHRWLTGYTIGGLLAGVWGFWVVMYMMAPMGRQGASYTLAALSLGMLLMHVLVGLANTTRQLPPERV